MIATEQVHAHLEAPQAPPARARAVAALARVEGRRLIRHPAIIVTVLLAVVQTAPFLLSEDATQERNVGWLLQISALVISFGALLAANLQALKSRRDGSEESFQAAPLTPAARTAALALAAAWVMVALTLLLLLGDLAIRAAGKGAATDSGHALFPLFDLVQGPLVAGLFVMIGIALARWLPNSFAAPANTTAVPPTEYGPRRRHGVDGGDQRDLELGRESRVGPADPVRSDLPRRRRGPRRAPRRVSGCAGHGRARPCDHAPATNA